MSSLQNMLNYLDENSLVRLIEELENLFVEKILIKILYTFLTIKVPFIKCFCRLYRQFDTKIVICRDIRGNPLVRVSDSIDIKETSLYYVLQIVEYLTDIKDYLLKLVLELKFEKIYYYGKIYIDDINYITIEVPYHKYILYKYFT